MDPAEDASLEPAIRWLLQSILASPLINEQAPWVREAELAEEMEGLKSEIKAVQVVVSVIKGRALGNEPLAGSLVELKELLYDTDDAVDELDYCRLLQLDQGDTWQTDGYHGASRADRSVENADVPTTSVTLPDPNEMDGHGTQLVGTQSSSVGKLRSKLWKEFEILEFSEKGAPIRAKCKHCKTELRCPTNQGTGVLQNHLKSKACPYDPLSTTDATANPAPVATANLLSSGKRRRNEEESTRLRTANTNRWNNGDFSKMIRDITHKLRHVREGVVRVLSIVGSDFAASSNHSQGASSHQRRRTTGTLQGYVYGRDFEKKTIIERMNEEVLETGAIVLPILGIAGVGKTALAKLVYNDPAVKDQFDYMWIWVSNSFDAMELTKDMLASVSQETHIGLCNFTKLQEILESHIKSKRVLLILDDVWDGIDDYQWNQLLAPFNSSNPRGNMIIVTTRKPCVAKRRGTVAPITLGALESDDFWLFFGACAFGDVNLNEVCMINYLFEKKRVSHLGKQIAQKLKGNPLAAETAGALLSVHQTVGHWSSILKNEDWKSLTLSGGIMSALKLCYDKLPYHLQKCFSYCSLFPCSYRFLGEELVRIWISQGFVKRDSSSKRLEEIGQDYVAELVNLGFFKQFKKKSSSGCYYVMYNLMHDFARVVSITECVTIDGLQCNRMFATVRHLSIISSSIYQKEDQTGNIARSEKFEEILRNNVTSVGKLRSLVIIGQYGSSFFQFFENAFQKAHNLCLLHLSGTSADFRSLLRSLNPAHLRYLKLENGRAEQEGLPQVLSKSFHLHVLDCHKYSGAWLASLQTVHLHKSGELLILPSLEKLQCLTRLKLSNMRNVTEVSVPSLEELILFEMPKLKTCSCISVGGLKSSLRVLDTQSCPVLEVFDLFQKVHNYETEHKSWLPSLKKLIISDCPNLDVMIPLPPSATDLEIKGSSSQTLRIKPNSVLGESPCEMTLDDKFLSFHNMRDLKYLKMKDCCNLVSITLRNFGYLMSLKSLEIQNCKELVSSDEDLMMPSNDGALLSLESLSTKECGITGKWLSLMLRNSPTLKKLYLYDCPQLTQLQVGEDDNIQSNLTSASEASSSVYQKYSFASADPERPCRTPLNFSSSLKDKRFILCPHLTLGTRKGFAGFTSLEKLAIGECPELVSADGRLLLPQSLEELDIECLHETLWPCFMGNLTHLKKLKVSCSPHLKSLQLDSCTAMEYLRICRCSSLATLEGLRSLVNLRELNVVNSPVLASLAMSGEGYQQIEEISSESPELLFLNFECSQLPGLESLHISELSLLTSSFCKGLSCLRSLSLQYLEERRLTDEQERALLLHGSLQELMFIGSFELLDLPAELHRLHSLKTLKIQDCMAISRLPKEGLPPSLEELEIEGCSSVLSAQCSRLATDELTVIIDGHYI
uniref:Uncharacterized protein n=2 Tax=Avena sativa TaxID=4498 RepID=A0ACD5Z8W5_AVESA